METKFTWPKKQEMSWQMRKSVVFNGICLGILFGLILMRSRNYTFIGQEMSKVYLRVPLGQPTGSLHKNGKSPWK